jgi:hypothetical protein
LKDVAIGVDAVQAEAEQGFAAPGFEAGSGIVGGDAQDGAGVEVGPG